VTHPHPDKQHVVTCVRRFIIGLKNKYGFTEKYLKDGIEKTRFVNRRGARSQVCYSRLIDTYLTAKRELNK
jgi:hypothetical protein